MNKSKLYMIICICILILSIGGSLAYYAWVSSDETIVNFDVCTPNIVFAGGPIVNSDNLIPVLDKEQGLKKEIKVNVNKNCGRNVTMNLYMQLDTLSSGLIDSTFVYELYKDNTLLLNDNFSDKKEGDTITLLTNEIVTTTTSTYTIYIYLDGKQDNPSSTQNQNFNFSIWGEGENAIYNAASMIRGMYLASPKDIVINNNIEYNYASNVSMMNDRLGGTTTDLDGGNVRYYGKNPNNYIYFNCDDYNNQTSDTCELWRIIGVFDNKVKIIRNEEIGVLSWDFDKNDDFSKTGFNNDWSTATLQKLLNDKYYKGIEMVTYYNGPSSSITPLNINFSEIGLQNDITRNMIKEATWNLAGWPNSGVFSDQIYMYERSNNVYSGRPTEWYGKIALMYASDYGYATDFTKCRAVLNAYGLSTNSYACRTNDWLFNSKTQWLLPVRSNYAWAAWLLLSNGEVLWDARTTDFSNGVRPTLFLHPNLEIISGEGSLSNPYKLNPYKL